MDLQARRQQILLEMAQIECMEKGRLTEEYREVYKDEKPVKLGPYYKYQRWENGKNVTRRVPIHEVDALRDAVDGYHKFKSLSDEYVQLSVELARIKSKEDSKKKPS